MQKYSHQTWKKTAYYLVWTKETIRIGYKNNPSLPTTLVQIICNNKWFSIPRLIHCPLRNVFPSFLTAFNDYR
jgi:hypothetical protein